MAPETQHSFDRESHRRGFLGLIGRAGIAVVGGIAGFAALPEGTAAAANWRCCSLYYGSPNCPINSYGSYYCPSGYRFETWTCCSGTYPWQRRYACAECVPNDRYDGNCWTGPFKCSAGWTVNANGC